MSYVKTIVCFANSRKTSGRCIAGKEWHKDRLGGWVRPISIRNTHEISKKEMQYENGCDPQLLDIIQINYQAPCPSKHQQENHLIDSEYYWEKKGRMTFNNVLPWIDTPRTLWSIGQSSYSGENDRIPVGEEDGTSLLLITIDKLNIHVGRKTLDYPDSKRAVLGDFEYHKHNYRIGITDPFIEQKYLAMPDGQYEIGKPLLCVSLGDVYKGYYYKLIAAVLYPGRFQ
ncbi:MAG: hypothetical protein UT30_C0026G0007 [Candidatus Uhrbacteria bacterium GW2011_GWF2_39_13]|uniref:Dual OB-containing domain-containing protein n=1 Tax=Candidatus Uhrbacteria bacterium GW2011_GWF2_39_13 TaxID=1618995 RepID=A0A0G0QPG6_9BACT|nr:MAG: hypothetical protein UT30_C0026G0007 [Candidatus Uhrbacteria bacterium GW2011_GWF2_39_13]